MENKRPRKILIVDDDQVNLTLLKSLLENMGLAVLTAQDALTGIEIAIDKQPSLIMLDIMMPNIDGFEACKRLKAERKTSSIPIIFLSAKSQKYDIIAGLEIGAVDYITKPFDTGELKARINNVLRNIELEEQILSLANTDALTGLANRRHFFNILEREILRAKIRGRSLSVMMLDIDHFKSVNDTYGHLAGDEIIKQVGKVLMENIYPLDVAGRYGGEEFIILMPGTSSSRGMEAAEKLRKVIDEFQWKAFNDNISITISIGLANIDANNLLDANDLIEKADAALYTAKRKGRNCIASWNKIEPEQDIQAPDNRVYHELQTKVESLTRQLNSHALGTISAFTRAMDMVIKDKYMKKHGKNVQTYAIAIAEEMHLSEELKSRIGTAALLQDLGKIMIPGSILKKTTPLTEEERRTINQHPVAATRILEPIGIFELELQTILHHHEKVDGTGYPSGLKGKEIPIGSRILAVADTFDAMTSEQGYSSAKSSEDALKEIHNCVGTQFDSDVVEAFQRAYEKHGSTWPLSRQKTLVTAN
ncbi:diguanylate cyclase [Planctomycetota bacterium]